MEKYIGEIIRIPSASPERNKVLATDTHTVIIPVSEGQWD